MEELNRIFFFKSTCMSVVKQGDYQSSFPTFRQVDCSLDWTVPEQKFVIIPLMLLLSYKI